MIRKIILTSKFKRSLRKFIKGNKRLQREIEETIEQIETDVFAPNLATHKLKGEFEGFRACSCGYDCRIIFSIEKEIGTNKEVIVLLNVGSHDEVY